MRIGVKEIRRIYEAKKNEFPGRDNFFYEMAISIEILRLVLGKEWTNQAIFSQHPDKPKITGEARKFLNTEKRGYKWQERINQLAERLFNMQDIENMKRLMFEIVRGGTTSRFAELEAGSHFYKRKIPFKFVNPSGEKESDYDIQIISNPPINCEVKHKIESTKLSENTIQKTLKNANNQLPRNKPGLITIKIPGNWTKEKEIKEILGKKFNSFFRRNRHIIAILLRWEEQRDFYGKGLFFWKFRLEKNPFFRFECKELNKILEDLESPPQRWIRLRDIIK